MSPTSLVFHAELWRKSPGSADVTCAAPTGLPVWITRPSALANRRVGAVRCRGFKRGVAQLGSALRSGRRGRGFESRHPDHESRSSSACLSSLGNLLLRTQLGYARVSTGHQSLGQQLDALTAAGVDANRVYSDKLSGMPTREQRPGLAGLLDYARPGDAIVVLGIDRLGRNAAEVMTTIRELGERNIVLRSLGEGIGGGGCASGTRAVHWPTESTGPVEDGLGPADARQRRVSQHDCGHTWREPRHRLQSACRRRLAHPSNQATNCDVAGAPRRMRARGGFE
jgi:Resolvase, N terminal domain